MWGQGQPDVWVVVVGSVLTALSALAAALFSYLSGRDKLKFEADRVRLEAKIERLTEETKQCHADKDAIREKCERLERDLREEIRELRDKLEQ